MHTEWRRWLVVLGALFLHGCATSRVPDGASSGASGSADRRALRGGGIEISLGLRGWEEEQGPALLHDNYFRLGLFRGEGGQMLSVLVDDLPEHATNLSALCAHSQKGYSSRGTVEMVERERVGGQPACLLSFVSETGGLRRREAYAELLVEGRWLELHYSAPEEAGAKERAVAAVQSILAPLAVKRLEGQPGALPRADLIDGEIIVLGIQLGCPNNPESFFCRALLAFKQGRIPSGRPEPVGLPGASVIVPALGSVHEGKAPVYEASYLTLSDRGVRYGTLKPENDEERRSALQLLRAVVASQPLPEQNASVSFARSLRAVDPAAPGGRSLIWRDTSLGYVRETTLGLVVIERVEGATLVGVFPKGGAAPSASPGPASPQP